MSKFHQLNKVPKQTAGTLSGMIIGGALQMIWLETAKTKVLLQSLGHLLVVLIGQNIGAQLDERDRFLLERLIILRLNIIHQIKQLNGEIQTLEIMVG